MMTRPQLRVFWQPESSRLHTVMVWETEVPSGVMAVSNRDGHGCNLFH